MSAQKLEAKDDKALSSVYTGSMWSSPLWIWALLPPVISPIPSGPVLFTELLSLHRGLPKNNSTAILGNSRRLHRSQSVQLSSLAGILTVNVSFGGVPVQDFKTALPPAPVQEPHCAEGQLPKLASFSDPACRGPKARGRFGIIALQCGPQHFLLPTQHPGRGRWKDKVGLRQSSEPFWPLSIPL